MKQPITFKGAIAAILIAIAGFLGGSQLLQSDFTGGNSSLVQLKTPINAVTASTTSSAIDIEGAKRVTLFINNAPTTDGFATTTYSVQVSGDGTNFTTYNKLIDNLANSNSQTLTRVASKASDDNEDLMLSLDLENDLLKEMKITATIVMGTTTTATVKSLIEY